MKHLGWCLDRMANCSFVYENNEVSLQQLLETNAKEIFENQNTNLKVMSDKKQIRN
jgi:hypothetical protein